MKNFSRELRQMEILTKSSQSYIFIKNTRKKILEFRMSQSDMKNQTFQLFTP